MNIQDTCLQKRHNKAVAYGVNQLHSIYASSAEGSLIYDSLGEEYIDFCGGVAVQNVGHRNDSVVAAVQDQLEKSFHTCFASVPYEPYISVCERLNKKVGNGNNKTHLLTTGSEAVESAVKIARCHTQRDGILVFSDAFHGRSFLTLAMNDKEAPYAKGMRIHNGDIYRCLFPNKKKGVSVSQAIANVEMVIREQCGTTNLAAIIIEPVQGEGGFHPCEPKFMEYLRVVCDKFNAVLIVDEIQSGVGRTGYFFAHEALGSCPDLVVFGKSLGGGLPISGVVGKTSIVDSVDKGGLGGTYAGNPISCAATLAVLRIFDSSDLLIRATKIGDYLRTRFASLINETGVYAYINGIGAMLAIEFFEDRSLTRPASTLVRELVRLARAHKLLLQPCGSKNHAIRFLMPLTINDDLLVLGMDRFEESLKESINRVAYQ